MSFTDPHPGDNPVYDYYCKHGEMPPWHVPGPEWTTPEEYADRILKDYRERLIYNEVNSIRR